MKKKLNCKVVNGPSLLDIQRSLFRNTDDPVFEVVFEYDSNVTGRSGTAPVLIQGLERPRFKKRFWKIRAACGDLSSRSIDEINVVLLYDPNKREGFLDFVFAQPSLLITATP